MQADQQNDVRAEAAARRPAMPVVADRAAWQAELDALRAREKAHTHEGDAIAAARRRLPMVEVDATTPLIGERGPVTLLDAFEGRRLLIAYYFMWHTGDPAPEQCEGCTFFTTQVRELSHPSPRPFRQSPRRTLAAAPTFGVMALSRQRPAGYHLLGCGTRIAAEQ